MAGFEPPFANNFPIFGNVMAKTVYSVKHAYQGWNAASVLYQCNRLTKTR